MTSLHGGTGNYFWLGIQMQLICLNKLFHHIYPSGGLLLQIIFWPGSSKGTKLYVISVLILVNSAYSIIHASLLACVYFSFVVVLLSDTSSAVIFVCPM
jgi:hypothetical protein